MFLALEYFLFNTHAGDYADRCEHCELPVSYSSDWEGRSKHQTFDGDVKHEVEILKLHFIKLVLFYFNFLNFGFI